MKPVRITQRLGTLHGKPVNMVTGRWLNRRCRIMVDRGSGYERRMRAARAWIADVADLWQTGKAP